MATVVLLGTLDTKGREYAFLRERLLEQGVDVLVVDAGVGEPVGLWPDVANMKSSTAKVVGSTVTQFVSRGFAGSHTLLPWLSNCFSA